MSQSIIHTADPEERIVALLETAIMKTLDTFQEELQNTVNQPPRKPKGWGARHTLAILGFWAFAISYAMRFNLSIAIVAMVNSTKHGGGSHGTSQDISLSNITNTGSKPACEHLTSSDDDLDDLEGQNTMKSQGEFNWNEAEQGLILGSFFWGYVLTQLPGGILSNKFGGKWPLGLGLLITAVFALITPWAARTHTYLLIFVRVVQGLGEGLTTPAMHEILAYWAPPNERSQLCSIVYAGAQFGTAATMLISGYLIHGGVMGGWPSVFYVIGAFSLVWFVLWVLFMYDRPSDHPRISKEELNYIEKSIGNPSEHEKTPTPWKAIFLSLPVWAIMVGHVGHAYGLYTLLTELPTYLNTVLQFDIKQNSWLSSLPYLLMWIASMIIPQIADLLITKKILKTVTVRKSCQAIAHLGSALALIAASYTGCDRLTTVTLLTLAVGINGAIYGGYVVNHVDIAPRHAGVLMGITNTVANLTGFGAPYVCGLLINNDPSLQNWQYVFFIAAAIYVVDVIFYGLFASSTEQKWNKGDEKHQRKTQNADFPNGSMS